MSELNVKLNTPTTGVVEAEIPADVEMSDLIPELITSLELPATDADGYPQVYRVQSKRLGRFLEDNETLESAGVTEDDVLSVLADITAGV